MKKYIDLTGQQFNRLLCVEYVGRTKARESLWRCVCDCGNEIIVRAADLKRGRTQSCGCIRKEKLAKNRPKDYSSINVKHGEAHSRLYNIWANMKQRCYNANNPNFPWYGAKGITICPEWIENYEAFSEWAMANGYADNLTIDREKSELGYSPENCRWIPHGENAGRAHRGITHN